jgi:hypothetical protein
MEKGAVILFAALAVAGTLATASALTSEALAMNGNHWIMLVVVLVVGYVVGRMFPEPGRMVGLP